MKNDFLTINEYSRPGKKRTITSAIVLHWTANPGASAKANRDFFEARKDGRSGYGSANYIIDTDGAIICAIPDDEVSYHCGSSAPDPASGKIYTDYARDKFGRFASKYSSPNNCTIGIELCPIDAAGNFTEKTLNAAAGLCAELCKKYGLTAGDITTHYAVVGWKSCPLYFVEHPDELERFKNDVKKIMEADK